MTLRERGRGVLSCRVCTRCWQSVVQAWHRHATAVVRWTAGGLLPTLIVSGAVAASYHPVAHGGQRAFLASIILTALATLFAAAIVAWQSGAVAWTLAAAGVILVAGHALHMVRLTQAPAAGVPSIGSSSQKTAPRSACRLAGWLSARHLERKPSLPCRCRRARPRCFCRSRAGGN